MGTIFRFHNDVDTDQILASQYLLYPTIDEMKVHTFESLDADFASQVKRGHRTIMLFYTLVNFLLFFCLRSFVMAAIYCIQNLHFFFFCFNGFK